MTDVLAAKAADPKVVLSSTTGDDSEGMSYLHGCPGGWSRSICPCQSSCWCCCFRLLDGADVDQTR